MVTAMQPWLHDSVVALCAPAQVWSAPTGDMSGGIHGIYLADTRLVAGRQLFLGGTRPQPLSHIRVDAGRWRFLAAARAVSEAAPGAGSDARVLLTTERSVTASGVREYLTVRSGLGTPLHTLLELLLVPDFSPMARVRTGTAEPPAVTARLLPDGGSIELSQGSVRGTLTAPGARLAWHEGRISVQWPLLLEPHGRQGVSWALTMTDDHAVVTAPAGVPEWRGATVDAQDPRLSRWVEQALRDLTALRLSTVDRPADVFLAAGAPWYLTLFGRDALLSARMLLPLGTELAASTLRVLAHRQGTVTEPATGEQPGKILHELRPAAFRIPGENLLLPPLYYGTIDATPLWICLLVDAWRWGLADAEIQALLPALLAALDWLRDQGESSAHGFLSYHDPSGHGLANQGWKDSAEAVQWRDGTQAQAPIALCEVQGYAFEAALGAAELLDHCGVPGAQGWREWADALAERFRAHFWVHDADGAYPAMALDARQQPVDAVASNMGHLLGTGLLNACEEELVAARLVAPALNSGVGLRTLAHDAAGYWPLSYHGGAVWTHDTALAITGLSRAGFSAEAATLSRGLLRAAAAFDYRLPELHSGDSAPEPYPAACRPQAWSAASAVAVVAATLELQPQRRSGTLDHAATSLLGPLTVTGLRLGGVPQAPLRLP